MIDGYELRLPSQKPLGLTYLRLVRCSDILEDPFGDVIYVNNMRRRSKKSREVSIQLARADAKAKKELPSES